MTIPEYLRARLEGGDEEGEAQTGRQCRVLPRATGFFLEFPTISVLNASLRSDFSEALPLRGHTGRVS